MSLEPRLRDQLQSLRISSAQRPGTAASGSRGSILGRGLRGGLLLLLGAGATLLLQRYGSLLRLPQAAQTTLAALEPAVDIQPHVVVLRRAPESTSVLTATGKIVSDHLVEVVTKVSGQIVALNFEQGDVVSAGQVLARIEDVNYRARRDQAAALLSKTEASLAFARANHDRVARLRQNDDSAVLEMAQAQRDLDEWTAQLAAERAALEFAEKQLADTEIRAPIAGVVLERNVEVGDFVAAEGGRGANANAQFAAIADMSKLRVEVDVSELDVGRIRKGMPATITPDAYKDRHYPGYVMWIDPGANYAKATVQIKVRIENPDADLRVDGAAQVRVFPAPPAGAGLASQPTANASARSADEIWIPASALLETADSAPTRVWQVVDQRLRATPVTIGKREGTLVEVRAGLRPGDTIVATGVDKLRDGQRVKTSASAND